jgi:hypothetical protein
MKQATIARSALVTCSYAVRVPSKLQVLLVGFIGGDLKKQCQTTAVWQFCETRREALVVIVPIETRCAGHYLSGHDQPSSAGSFLSPKAVSPFDGKKSAMISNG